MLATAFHLNAHTDSRLAFSADNTILFTLISEAGPNQIIALVGHGPPLTEFAFLATKGAMGLPSGMETSSAIVLRFEGTIASHQATFMHYIAA